MESPKRFFRKRHSSGRRTRLTGVEGIDFFVRCRICGDRRRVISGRHLDKHDISRGAYLARYNLGPDQLIAKDFHRINSSLPGYRPFGKSDWITEIKEIYRRKPNASSRWLQLNHSNLHHQGTWIFGDWDSALRAAGFDPEEKRIEKVWSADRVIREMRKIRAAKQPLYAWYALQNYRTLFRAGLRYYGSWTAALRAAGLGHARILRPSRGRHKLLMALQAARNDSAAIPRSVRLQAELYFGSLEKAFKAARVPLGVKN